MITKTTQVLTCGKYLLVLCLPLGATEYANLDRSKKYVVNISSLDIFDKN
jgi:hypothetical protein